MPYRNRPFRRTVEPLEVRRVMDGTVNVVLSGSTLKITGDDLNNRVQVKLNGAGLRIEGESTAVTFNGSTAAFQDIAGLDFTKLDLKFDLKRGDDLVQVGDGLAQLNARSLSIATGAGNDSIRLNALAIAGNTNVTTFQSPAENDADDLMFFGISTFTGDLKIRTGGGNDAVTMVRTRGPLGEPPIDQTNVGKRLTVDVGSGDDAVFFDTYVCANATIRLGDGTNQFTSFNGTVTQKLDVRSGKGVDTLTAGGGNYNKIAVNLGDGDDIATADDFTVADIRMNMGRGNDTLNGNALNMTQFDLFDGGAGNDTLNFTATNSNVPNAGALPKNFEVQNIT